MSSSDNASQAPGASGDAGGPNVPARDPITFYFDFASPYAYLATSGLEEIAEAHGRVVVWRPILGWAVLKAQGLRPPVESRVKFEYLLKDMARSAAFHGVPYHPPETLTVSSHLAARLFHVLSERDPGIAIAFARRVFAAMFAEGRDISDKGVLHNLAAAHNVSAEDADEAMTGDTGREMLKHAVDQAVADGVCGSPFFILDKEGFFGADRLPQLRWRLELQAGHGNGSASQA